MDGQQSKADVFLHGSKWLRADFHLHTHRDQEFRYEGEADRFLSDYVQKLKQEEIQIGVVTNHNKFDMDEFKGLRKKAKKEGIYLLPGVELSVNDGQSGLHILVVFHEDWIEQDDYINPFLSAVFRGKSKAEVERENGRSNDGLLETIHILEKENKEFFIVLAHVEDDKGFWHEFGGGRIQELGQLAPFKRRIIAFQKVRTRDLREKVQQWLGDSYPAEVEGSDCKSIEEIGKGKKCYLKLGAFTFIAVKYALHNRISCEAEHYQHSYIKSISFEGGRLNGHEIHFSPELNTFIGVRGSGKSSIIESLRYILDIPFGENTADAPYKNNLVMHTLGSGGKIIIRAVDQRGVEYELRRILNEYTDVYVDGVLRPGLSIRETIIHRPIYFGQKDLSSSGEGFEKDLVEKLLGNRLDALRLKIEEQKQKVKTVAEQLYSLSNVEEKILEYQAKKQDAEYKLAIFKKHGIEEKLQRQVDFDADTRICQQTEGVAGSFLDDLEEIINRHEDELKNQKTYKSRQNEKFFTDYFSVYNEMLNLFDQVKGSIQRGREIVARLQGKAQDFAQIKAGLKEEFAHIERQLAEELESLGAVAIRPEEYRQINKTLEQAKSILENLNKQKTQRSNVQDYFLREIAGLNELWHQEYTEIHAILDEINVKNPALKIQIFYKEDKEAFLQFCKSIFKGSGIREQRLEHLTQNYADFGQIYKDIHNVMIELGINAGIFEQYFYDNLKDLLTWQVPNAYKMEYYGKELKDHSLGQRASALILFVLSQEDNDVFIIDQPEDDLDNQTIYEDVIKLLCKLKNKTQFIFATHNANFPVLGDAEQIFSCEYVDDKIQIESGSIDVPNIQKKIVAIMEGGKDAFEKRKEVYDIWMQQNY